jgi:nitrite reductase (NADH) small subunit
MITAVTNDVHCAGPVELIPAGEGRTVRVAGEEIAIFRTRPGELFAVQARCPHKGGPLADGIVGGTRVVCPLHAFPFELSTGESLRSGCPALRTYPVFVDDEGLIQVAVAK